MLCALCVTIQILMKLFKFIPFDGAVGYRIKFYEFRWENQRISNEKAFSIPPSNWSRNCVCLRTQDRLKWHCGLSGEFARVLFIGIYEPHFLCYDTFSTLAFEINRFKTNRCTSKELMLCVRDCFVYLILPQMTRLCRAALGKSTDKQDDIHDKHN